MENKKEQLPELVLVPLALMNDIMSYLGTKPFTEVAPYINAIQKESQLVSKPEVPPNGPIAEEVKSEDK